MQAQPTHRRTTLLHVHIEQLSPAQQRDCIAATLALIAARNMLDEVENTVSRIQPLLAPSHIVLH